MSETQESRHFREFPDCADPDCEFHHREVREFHTVQLDPSESPFETIRVTFDDDGTEREIPGSESIAVPVRCVDCGWNHIGSGTDVETILSTMTELHNITRKDS